MLTRAQAGASGYYIMIPAMVILALVAVVFVVILTNAEDVYKRQLSALRSGPTVVLLSAPSRVITLTPSTRRSTRQPKATSTKQTSLRSAPVSYTHLDVYKRQIFDFVPVHFAVDEYGLKRFDGTALYEYPAAAVGESEWGLSLIHI